MSPGRWSAADGDRVVAGTVSTDSSLRVRVAATGEDTALAGIQRLVSEAQNSASRAQLLADRAAAWLFWFALIAALITAVVWTALGQPASALVRTHHGAGHRLPARLGPGHPSGGRRSPPSGRPAAAS